MKKCLLFLALAVLLSGCSTKAQYNPIQVTYVGNSGFLITVGDKKVLIDALFDGFPPDYTLPGDVQAKIQDSQPPFDDVDLILVSHNHPDHFSPTMVGDFLQNNPETIVISTSQVTSPMTGLEDRAISVNPSTGSPVNVEANGIQVEAIYISHGLVPAGETEITNNAYLVTVNGITFFHTGDIADLRDANPYNLANRNIDLAFLTHFYFQDGVAVNLIETSIGAKYYFPIHYQFTTPSINVDLINNNYPKAITFSNELETWTMP